MIDELATVWHDREKQNVFPQINIVWAYFSICNSY